MNLKVRITLEKGSSAPEYKTLHAAGCDVRALTASDIVIPPGGRFAVPTGLRMEIPEGYEAQVRPRSGLALEHGITCLNTPGTIDADYRGEVKVILANLGSSPFTVRNGDRIAQIVFAACVRAEFPETDSLAPTERGSGGFGSTGV